MDYIAAFNEVGTFRGAADMCGTTHKTVSRAVHRQKNASQSVARAERQRNYDIVEDLVTARMKSTKGRISAKRLLPQARKAGYAGSARNFPAPGGQGPKRLPQEPSTTGGGRLCGHRASTW